jgi:hypothetical protein
MSKTIALHEIGRVIPRKPTRPRPVAEVKKPDKTPALETAFRRMGLSESGAKVAAAGRGGDRPRNLAEVGRGIGLSPSASSRFARGRGMSEAAKVTDGAGFFATDWAYHPSDDPTTWRYLLVKQPGDGALGAYDSDLVQKAATALSVDDYAVAQPDVPKADLAGVKQTVAGAWVQSGLALADMPPGLVESGLATAFKGMGHSESAARIMAKGRA